MILDQNAGAVRALRFGRGNVSAIGCGPIAVYNALLLLRQTPSFSAVLHQFEQEKSLALAGRWGTDPRSIPRVLSRYGVFCERYCTWEALMRRMQAGSIAVIMIWNRKDSLRAGAHFFTLQQTQNGYAGYNLCAGTVARLNDADALALFARSRYICGYLLADSPTPP